MSSEIINSQLKSNISKEFHKEKNYTNIYQKTKALNKNYGPEYTHMDFVDIKTGSIGANNELIFNLTETYSENLIHQIFLYSETTKWHASSSPGVWNTPNLGGANCIQNYTFYSGGEDLLTVERDTWDCVLAMQGEEYQDWLNKIINGSNPDLDTNGFCPMITFWNGLAKTFDPKHSLIVPLLQGKDLKIKMRLVSSIDKIGSSTSGTVTYPNDIKIGVVWSEIHPSLMCNLLKHTNKANLVNWYQLEKSEAFTGTTASQIINQDLTTLRGNVKALISTIHGYSASVTATNFSAFTPYTGKFSPDLLLSSVELKNGGKRLKSYNVEGCYKALMSESSIFMESSYPSLTLPLQFCKIDPKILGSSTNYMNREELKSLKLYLTVTLAAQTWYIYTVSISECYLVYLDSGKIEIRH